MNFETILYDVQDGILTITLNRPERLNAFNNAMRDEVIAALDAADADDEVKAIIFTGAGRAFCAGADLGGGGDTFNYKPKDPGVPRDGGGLLTLRIFECLKPVISACNGAAVGIGATMQCAMDIRLASENAKYGFVFSKRGIVPEAASSWFLPRVVGISTALEWTFSGRVFPADEARNRGFVRTVYPADELMPAARELAKEFCNETSAVSVAMARQMMWKMLGADHPMEAHQIDSRGVYFTGKSEDAKEGVKSFLEKRPASYPGKVSSDMPEFFPWWEPRDFN
jgi:enoyl-CoA hydratase/carnithine racemase